jgi:glutamine amidotransferase
MLELRLFPMCRLFGFRSVIPSKVHRSLLAAENALGTQSNQHPDGWGVAFYVDGAPHVTRSPQTALGDQLFHRLSGVVSSQTVLAHVRKATRGDKTVLNCHPFQYGRWVFAHNGDVPDFERHRPALMAEVASDLTRFVLGETDSEVLFFVFLTELARQRALAEDRSAAEVAAALRKMDRIVRSICETPEAPASLTVVVTNGETLAASHGGKDLFLSTYKTRCSDRHACKSLSPECEAPTTTGRVNHCILSSEPLQGENVWIPLKQGDVVSVDARMHVVQTTADRTSLPVVASA